LIEIDGRFLEFYDVILSGIDLLWVLFWVANWDRVVFLDREEFFEFGGFGEKSNENWLKKHGISRI
jgi:hypothetical protein